MRNIIQLPTPSFYNPKNAERWNYRPTRVDFTGKTDALSLADAWRKQHAVKPSISDSFKLLVLLIDDQLDFCHPEGSLFVGGRSGRGAIDDSARTAEFIYRNLPYITEIHATLDTHFAYQIFTQSFWQVNGGHPGPFTLITEEMVAKGYSVVDPRMVNIVRNSAGKPVTYKWLQDYALHYTRKLTEGKYPLIVWTPHCELGEQGHALVGVIQEACNFHSYVRGVQSFREVKGGSYLTENYGILEAEVLLSHDNQAIAQKNTRFFQKLMLADAIAIGGQAASHCVRSSIAQIKRSIQAIDPALAAKCYIMTDTTSAVVTPQMDFTPEADAAMQEFADAGMHLVKSTDPLETWPGLRLAA